LEFAARFVQAHQRLRLDLHAIACLPIEKLVSLSEHDAAHLGVLVLKNEISVSRLGHGEVGYLPGDPKQRIATLEQARTLRMRAETLRICEGECVETRASPCSPGMRGL